jgi:hypothetical protein
MSLGHFAGRRQPPSSDEIRSALGGRFPLWQRLTQFIESNYGIAGRWSTWGPAEHGWGLRYRVKGRALAALYPQKGMFVALVVLGKAAAERALGLALGEVVSKMLRKAPQLRDGRWLSIPVRDATDARDVERLLYAKTRPSRRPTGDP